MALLDTIKDRVRFLEKTLFYRYMGLFLAVVLIFLLGIVYYFYSSKNDLLKKFKTLNYNRLQTQEILTRYAAVQNERGVVEDLLSQGGTFFISQYFSDLITKLNIPASSTQQEEPAIESVSEDYNQIRLGVSISGLDMKQLTDLIYAIEQEERIYIEELDIKKDNKLPKIDVNIVIVTLEPKQPQTE